jgi:hypothetical protein
MSLARLADRYRVQQDPLRSERRIELACLVLALMLLLQLVWVAARALVPPSPAPVEPAASSLTVADQLARRAVGSQASADLRERPLFWEGRRAVAAADSQAVPVRSGRAPRLQGVRLLGVFGAGDSGGIIALVENRQQRIQVGEELSGWTLQSVTADGATLVNDGATEILDLQRSSGSITVAEPAAAPAATSAPAADDDGELTLGGRR